jgi:hypothetical protein
MPVKSHDAEWLRSHAKYLRSLIGAGKGTLFFESDARRIEHIAALLDRAKGQAHWRIGPLEWTRAGVTAILRLGRVKLLMCGRLWKVVWE